MKNIYMLMLCLITFVGSTQAQTERVEFKAPGTYPEGVAYHKGMDVFFVSSARKAVIGKVTPAGNYTIVLNDTSLKSTFGMKIDEARNLLWFCAGDPNYSMYRDSSTWRKMTRLIALDCSTGKKVKDIDLSNLFNGYHFPNDITLDDKGNIYMTDSYSPVIYKVDVNGASSVFAKSDWFSSVGVGLNGIAWHPAGYLLVANNGSGAIFKVDMNAPTRVGKVKLSQFFPGADGLLLDDANNLLLVQNKGVNKVFRLTSRDNWQNASVTAATESKAMFAYPSTITKRKDVLWVMNARLSDLADSNVVIAQKFSLQRADLKPVK